MQHFILNLSISHVLFFDSLKEKEVDLNQSLDLARSSCKCLLELVLHFLNGKSFCLRFHSSFMFLVLNLSHTTDFHTVRVKPKN